jgi:phosphate-selective porin OprO and OprP
VVDTLKGRDLDTSERLPDFREGIMKARGIVAILAVAVALLAVPSLSRADRTDDLIQILKDKGAITNEEAAILEKKAKPEAPSARDDWTKKIEVGYKDGAFIKTKDDRFTLLTNVGVQGQYNYQWLENNTDRTTFTIRRARLIESGNAFYPWLKFFVQITLEQAVNLRDAYVTAAYYKWLTPQVGQFKVPFDREYLTSGFNLQLIERSIASTEFSLQRDVGLQVSGFPAGDLFEYRAGIFNGSGANQDNVNNKFMYVGRLVLTPFGPYPYSQSALDTPKRPLLAIGAAGAFLPDLAPGERRSIAGVLGSTSEVPVRSDVYQLTGDGAFKWLNFSFEGAYHYRIIDPQLITRLGRQNASGYFVQAGYLIFPKHFEIAGRYSYVNPDNPVQTSNNNQEEVTGGLSYYFEAHRLKLQANFTYLHTQGSPRDQYDKVVRSEVTLMF